MTREQAIETARRMAPLRERPVWIYTSTGRDFFVDSTPYPEMHRYHQQWTVAVVLTDGRVLSLEERARPMSREEYVSSVDGEWG